MKPSEFQQLRNVCKVIGELKSQIITTLPHFGHQGLFFQNDEITTGQLNNTTEIKINLLTGQLLFFHNERGNYIDLAKDHLPMKIKQILTKLQLKCYCFRVIKCLLN